jgi:hypothetical protein
VSRGKTRPPSRRAILAALAMELRPFRLLAQTGNVPVTLLSAPIEMTGNWENMIPGSAAKVVNRMRSACLADVRLLSDRQPQAVRVDEHTSGVPSIWLHPGQADRTAWIIVDIGDRDWSKLAYQFGHELGHVLANSWRSDARPAPPCQWIEEALVEAFSIFGLARLAESWKRDPPFPDDNGFGQAIATYRQNIINDYRRLAGEQGASDFRQWFARNRSGVEAGPLTDFAKAASLTMLAIYEEAPSCIEALGALNRWPARSGAPIEDYFRLWLASCVELSASAVLPDRLKRLLRLS